MFRAFDHNGDGLIEFRDILTTFSVMGTAASNDDKNGDGEAKRLRWAFRIYDLDGDGYISREEMLQVLKVSFKTNVHTFILFSLRILLFFTSEI